MTNYTPHSKCFFSYRSFATDSSECTALFEFDETQLTKDEAQLILQTQNTDMQPTLTA